MLGLHFCVRAFSSCGKRGSLFIAVCRPLSLRSTGSRRTCSVVVAHGPSCSPACGIFPDRARTRVPCIGRQILNHCATREALLSPFDLQIQVLFSQWFYFHYVFEHFVLIVLFPSSEASIIYILNFFVLASLFNFHILVLFPLTFLEFFFFSYLCFS